MKNQFKLESKYLIEKKNLFSRQHLVLFLQDSHIHMQPLNKDRDEKDTSISKMEWDSIVSVQASERNSKEFTIFTLPPNKKKGATGKQGTQQQEVFSCKDRNKLITEMVHQLHLINEGGKPQLMVKAYHQNDIYNASSKIQVSIRIHPTLIQIKTEVPNAWSIKRRQNQSSLKEENKAFFDEADENYSSDEEEKPEDRGEFIEHDPFAANIEGAQAQQHFIYLSDIDRVYAITDYLLVIKKNQEIEKLILKNEETMKEALTLIKQNHRDHFKTHLFYMNFQSFEQEKILSEIEFLKRGEQIVYSQDVQVQTWNGVVGGLQLDIDENYIYEVEKKEKRVRKRCLLKYLDTIRIVDSNHFYNLMLKFKDDTQIAMKVPSLVERQRLISAILTLRSFSFPPQGQIDHVNILINSDLNLAHKILGHDSVENAQYTQEYEGLLFRKISEIICLSDHHKVDHLIEEALLNASFISLVKIDNKSIRSIVKEIQMTLEHFLSFEVNEPHIVDQVLHYSNDDCPIDYFRFYEDKQLIGQFLIEDQEGKANQFSLILDKVSKYLNILNLFLNAKVFLADMAEHEALMLLLIKCLMSKSPFIGLLASQCLKGMVHHYSGNESKIEGLNKRVMIRGKQQDLPLSQPQLEGPSDDDFHLAHAVFDYLKYFDHLHNQTNKVKSLHYFNICNILRSILNVRRVSTGREELQIFASFIIDEKPRVDKAPPKANESVSSEIKDDPSRNKPLFHLVDKFCLLGEESFEIKYLFTLIFNESLGYFKKYETTKLYDFQMYILTYSIQFLWHLHQVIDSPIKEQRKASIHLLAKLLYLNSESNSLLQRCYPQPLLDRFDTPTDLSQSLPWQETEWETFFNIVTQKTFDTATEQWNDETRAELKSQIEQELDAFKEANEIHKAVIADGHRTELILPNHEFNKQNLVVSKCLNLKWNYTEFVVKHTSLNNKYLVWKYYLAKLLEENNDDERKKPQFVCDIQNPVIFWNELKIKFMSSFNKDEQKIILKAMCVLYNTKYQQLNKLKSIPYWLKLLNQDRFHHYHFILLQLMHIALSVQVNTKQVLIQLQGEIGQKNMKAFIKNNGLMILINCMKLVFKELNKNEISLPQLMNIASSQILPIVQETAINALSDSANYTNSETNSRYFKRNSENVCMGILSLKILDLIFKEMNKIDLIPLPTNMDFLMRADSLYTLTQMFMIENTDLTRELTIFMHMHLNNHFSFYKMRNTCMIELLIRCLCTRNGDRALDLLEQFQEAHINYNSNLKLGIFNSNDLKMIQDDKHRGEDRVKKVAQQLDLDMMRAVPLLGESLFLRFLPIPFIKFLYEKGKNKFIEVYKMQNYETPILIWNAELRSILENAIKDHTHDFITQMREFAKLSNKQLKDPDELPHYKKPFRNIIRYPSIENEVRCGRYYLRVWVSQKVDSENFFRIPIEEEDEFQNNIQAELRQCIYEDQFDPRDQQKIIILFKACLLIFKTYASFSFPLTLPYSREKSKIISLDQVQRILIKVCRDQVEYSDNLKQIIYLGIKIIINSCNITLQLNQNDQLSSMKATTHSAKYVIDDNLLKVALTKTGVEMCQKILQLILSNSFISQRKSFKQTTHRTLQSSHSEATNKIVIDRIEAKTLSLCVKYLNIMLNNDIQDFVDLPLSQRIGLFKQISRVFDLGLSLLPLFKNRQLTNYEQYVDSKTYSSSYFNLHSNLAPNSKSKKARSNKRRSKKRRPVLTSNQSGDYKQPDRVKKTHEFREELKYKKHAYKKDPAINYNEQTLLSIIKQHADSYSIQLIMNLQKNIFELTREATKNPMLHPELIASGMAWKAIQQVYFNLKDEAKKFRDLDISIKSASITLKNLISFAKQIAEKGAESFAFKNLTKDTEQDIILKFWQSINCIFSSKILETLTQTQFIITSNLLSFPNYDPRKFLRQFSVLEEKSPELVWNDETRAELASTLDQQIKNLDMSHFCDSILDFEYSVNKRELRVNNIFVRHFNTTTDFKLYDVNEFAQLLILKIKEIVHRKETKEQDLFQDLNRADCDNCIELVKAFKILLKVKELQMEDQYVFEDFISVFCDLIRVKPTWEPKVDDPVITISEQVIDILKLISESGGIHFEYMKNYIDFIRLLIRCLYGKEKEAVNMTGITDIMKSLLSSDSVNVEVFLIRTGLIYFILNQIFDSKAVKRVVRVELIKVILQTSQYTKAIYRKYIPPYFFVEIESKFNNDFEVEKIIELINNFDAPSFANVFIIWNTSLKMEIHGRIKENCEKIVEAVNAGKFEFDLDDSEIHNPYLENEIRVSDIILRIYNENPAIYINMRLNTFILHLSKELQTVGQELFRMIQSDDTYFYPNFVPHTKLQAQNQKKFKYICYQSLLLLTSLLLSIEQLLYNDFNPNRPMATKKEDKHKLFMDKAQEQVQLDKQFYPLLGFWLQTQVFLSKQMPVEIRLTFLQIIFLVIEMNDAIKILKDNQCLIQFITDSIEKINAEKFEKTLEEALIFFITQKMLREDSEPTPTLISTSMPKIIKIYEKKKKLKKLIEFIFLLMSQDAKNKQAVIDAIEQCKPAVKIDIRLLQDSENTEAIMKIWRNRPASQTDAKTYFDFKDCSKLEEKLDEMNILKLKLPLLSERSVHSINKEEVFIDETNQSELNPTLLDEMFLSTEQSSRVNFNKLSQLGFEPIINEEYIIGGGDIEAIEKRSEGGDNSSDDLE